MKLTIRPVRELPCDRCKHDIEVYSLLDVTDPAFARYSKPGEKNVCVHCLNQDPAYARDHPSGVS